MAFNCQYAIRAALADPLLVQAIRDEAYEKAAAVCQALWQESGSLSESQAAGKLMRAIRALKGKP